MVRVDVFLVPGTGITGCRCVADTLKPELPNRAVVQGKPYSEWKEMREEDFIFSLYPNDLVYAEHKSGLKFTLQNADSTLEKTRTQTSAFVYFVGGSISTASITIRTHDNAYGIPSLGVKTLKTFHKYQVDVLGNVFPVHKETRQNSADSSKKRRLCPPMRSSTTRTSKHAQRTACCGNGRAPHRAHRGHQRADAGKPPRHAFGCRAFRFGAKRNGGVRVRRKAFTLRRAAAIRAAQPPACRGTRAAFADAARQKRLAAARHRQNRQPGGMSAALCGKTQEAAFCIPRTRRDKRR